jgi:hypothetical protein
LLLWHELFRGVNFRRNWLWGHEGTISTIECLFVLLGNEPTIMKLNWVLPSRLEPEAYLMFPWYWCWNWLLRHQLVYTHDLSFFFFSARVICCRSPSLANPTQAQWPPDFRHTHLIWAAHISFSVSVWCSSQGAESSSRDPTLYPKISCQDVGKLCCSWRRLIFLFTAESIVAHHWRPVYPSNTSKPQPHCNTA